MLSHSLGRRERGQARDSFLFVPSTRRGATLSLSLSLSLFRVLSLSLSLHHHNGVSRSVLTHSGENRLPPFLPSSLSSPHSNADWLILCTSSMPPSLVRTAARNFIFTSPSFLSFRGDTPTATESKLTAGDFRPKSRPKEPCPRKFLYKSKLEAYHWKQNY